MYKKCNVQKYIYQKKNKIIKLYTKLECCELIQSKFTKKGAFGTQASTHDIQ